MPTSALPCTWVLASAAHLIYQGDKVSTLLQLRCESVSSLPLLGALEKEWSCHCHCRKDPRCSQPSHQLQQLHPHRTLMDKSPASLTPVGVWMRHAADHSIQTPWVHACDTQVDNLDPGNCACMATVKVWTHR